MSGNGQLDGQLTARGRRSNGLPPEPPQPGGHVLVTGGGGYIGIERFVLATSCSLYDGLPTGMHDETVELRPRGAYATSKRYAEESLLALAGDGLTPVLLRNGTVYGWSPRMRFDLVVNTFVKDALLEQRLLLHGGAWMWRPLVDVRDVSDAMIL